MIAAREKTDRTRAVLGLLAWGALFGAIVLLGGRALAGQAGTAAHLGVTYDTYTVADPAGLRLFWKDAGGRDYRNFGRVKEAVEARGGELVFAMNAGMFHTDHRPVGLYIEEGALMSPLNLEKGRGNFFKLPNGVFYVTDKGAGVLESRRFAKAKIAPRLATQSGPLLLEKGRIHPQFLRNSTSRKIRNGVGVRASGEVVFAISRSPVGFYDFALFFRDALGCPDALYLDGTISEAFIPVLGRRGLGGAFGPIVGDVGAEAAN